MTKARAYIGICASIIVLSCARGTPEKDMKIMDEKLVGKTIKEIYTTKIAANEQCLIGASPPVIYSKSGDNFLDGILPKECASLSSFENSLIEREKTRPPKSQNTEFLQVLKFNSESKIARLEPFDLALAASDPETTQSLLKVATKQSIQRFKIINKSIIPITEDAAIAKDTVDYYRLVVQINKPALIYRITKKSLGAENWNYGSDGKLIDVKAEL